MSNTQRLTSLGFTAEQFPAGTHMCYIYNDDQERLETISKFIESGLQEHEKATYLVDLMSPDDMRKRLHDLGMNTPPTVDERALQILRATDTYCPDNTFVPDHMLQNLRTMYTTSIAEGYAGARASGEMSWALRGIPGSDRLVEYEARINILVREYPTTAICQYDARRFDGATLFDILNVHPMMIVRGQVVRNPYYIEPEDYLESHHCNCEAHNAA